MAGKKKETVGRTPPLAGKHMQAFRAAEKAASVGAKKEQATVGARGSRGGRLKVPNRSTRTNISAKRAAAISLGKTPAKMGQRSDPVIQSIGDVATQSARRKAAAQSKINMVNEDKKMR